jgi:purine-binding chemotaxis protein CheW
MTNINQKKKILKERADLLKIQIKKEDIFGEIIEGLEFILADERYAIDSTYVSEVIPLKDLTSLPCTPDFILGIINVRGKILSVVDLKKFFNLPEKGITNLNRVIIVKHDGIELGILADEIAGSMQIYFDKLQSKISTITEVKDDFIIGITEDRLIVLDIKEFLLNEKLIINEEV